MRKNIYEVLEEFQNATTKQDRINVLLRNNTQTLRNFLAGSFHPDIKFTVKTPPEYKSEEVPPGMSYSNMDESMARVYLFQEGNTRCPPNLTDKRKNEILIQLLEGMEPKEAELFSAMLTKTVKVPFLTPNLIKEAFPGLIPE